MGMKAAACTWALAVLLLLTATAPALALDREATGLMIDIGRHLTPMIARVQTRTADGRMNAGSGVPIAADLIATNCHVTRRADFIQVIANGFQGPTPYRVIAQAVAINRDVCVLRLANRLAIPPARFGNVPKVDAPVVAIGFTGGMRVRLHVGEVRKLHELEGAQVIETSTAFDQGASGGGLFDDNGELVGLISFRSQYSAQHGQLRYFSMPTQWITDLVNGDNFQPIAPQTGRAFWEETGASLPDFLRGQLSPKDERASESIRVPQFESQR